MKSNLIKKYKLKKKNSGAAYAKGFTWFWSQYIKAVTKMEFHAKPYTNLRGYVAMY